MKTLVIESISSKPHLETAAEIIFRIKEKKNNKIKFAWIGSQLPWNDWSFTKLYNFFGISHEKRIKSFIKFLINNNIDCIYENNLPVNISFIERWGNRFNGNIKDLRGYRYKNFSLGEGVASSLISFFKNENLNLKKIIKLTRKTLISSAIILERTRSIILNEKPNKIITFNGRFSISHPIVLAAKKAKIQILFHERGSSLYKFEIFKDNIHNQSFRAKEIIRYWRLNGKNKKKIGHKYFIKRRNRENIESDIGYSYAKNQKENYINFKHLKKKRIIVFYTSTDYEYAAGHRDYGQEKYFKKFLLVVKKFNDIHIIIRIHPGRNERNIIEDQKWNKYASNGVTVINSDDKTDSYKLMDIADIVVTYSSRIIIEAAYWGKNTISLSNKQFYSRFKIAICTHNSKLLKKILKHNYIFKKVNKEDCIKIGYYFENFGIKYKYYKPINYFDGKFINNTFEWKFKLIVILELIGTKRIYKYIKNKIKYYFISFYLKK